MSEANSRSDVSLIRERKATHWHAKDGSAIKITDMDNQHLDNCIAMLLRHRTFLQYEMALALGADPYDLAFDDSKFAWWYLTKMRAERERRDRLNQNLNDILDRWSD